MTVKDDFIHQLNPLLQASEIAIKANNVKEARRLASETLKLVLRYADLMNPDELKDALNNPTANEIAKRLV